MKSPRFSIVINNYNYARFLMEAVDSALIQNVDKEVIVVDDGSTDESPAVLEQARLKGCIVVSKPNGGQASAFNVGFSTARGEWIHFLDADDILLPGAFEEVEKKIRPGLAKIHFPLEVLKEGQGRTGVVMEGNGLSNGNVMDQIAKTGHHNWPPTTGNIYSRECLNALLPMDEQEYRICADLYLNTHAPFFGELEAVDTAQALYRIHGKNLYATNLASNSSRISNASLKVRSMEIIESRLAERGYDVETCELYKRSVSMERLLALQFGVSCSSDSRQEIIRRFRNSREYRNAPAYKKPLWVAILAVYAWSPKGLLWKFIDAREKVWRFRSRLRKA